MLQLCIYLVVTTVMDCIFFEVTTMYIVAVTIYFVVSLKVMWLRFCTMSQ